MNKKRSFEWLTHFFGTTLGHAVGTFVLGSVFIGLKALRDQLSIPELWRDWRELISPFIIAMLIMMLLGLLRKYLNARHVLQSFGVRVFSKHGEDEKDKDWDMVRADLLLASTAKSELSILGATGVETFASAECPLGNVLRKYDGPIRVLLIAPESFAFHKRVEDIETNAAVYADEIEDAIEFCCALKKRRGRNIELRLYEDIATWKMLLTNKQVWLQHYKKGVEVDDMPMYCFIPLEGEPNLHEAFESEFDRRWALNEGRKVDLDTWKRSASAPPNHASRPPSSPSAPAPDRGAHTASS